MEIKFMDKTITFNKKKLYIFSFILIIVSLIVCVIYFDQHQDVLIEKTNLDKDFYSKENPDNNNSNILSSPNNLIKPSPKPTPKDLIQVYVVGEVLKPGTIVSLQKGQIIHDALNQAGGVTKNADITSINVVYKLTENVMLKVLSKDQISKLNPSNTSDSNETTNSGILIIKEPNNISIIGASQNDSNNYSSKININTATSDDLCFLQGIGKSTADKIIQHRNENGPFKKISDIMNVSGIGINKYNSIKNNLTIN